MRENRCLSYQRRDGAFPIMDQAVIPTIETGMELEEHSFVWEIKNFPVVLTSDALINSQKVEVGAGERLGQPCKWKVYLAATTTDDGNKSIGVFYRCQGPLLDQRPPPGEELFSQIRFAIKNVKGETTWNQTTTIRELPEAMRNGWGFTAMLDRNLESPPDSLKIHITLKLYSPANQTEHAILQKYQARFGARVLKDLAVLLKKPITGDANIVSCDQQEFVVPWGTLAARSPVFEAMLRTGMNESSGSVIRLPDMTGKGLGVLLQFICVGELLPDWKESGVVVELTNAAAKYQFSDLLEFLDCMLGKVCDLDNVLQLFTLANQLSLKTAEKELLKFIREKGASSPENFVQIMKVISGQD